MDIRKMIGEATDYDKKVVLEKKRPKNWCKSVSAFANTLNIIDGGGNLTNAGALLADESPIWYSRAFCTRWNGLKKTEAIDSAEYSGSIIYLLSESSAFIRRNMKVKWKKLPESRVNLSDYIERSYFEALVNGFIHRDYLVTGGEVHVDIFDDRLEIYSPGGMVDGTMIQDRNIDYVPSERRNPLLADIFARLDYMERKGSGLGLIRDEYSNAPNYIQGKEPVFYSDFTQFRIILPNLNYENEIVDRLIDNGKRDRVQDGVQGREQDRVQEDNKAINLIADDVIGQVTTIEFLDYCKLPRTRAEMQEFCGLVARRSFNERYLKPLLEKGVLKMTIPDKPRSKNQKYYSEL